MIKEATRSELGPSRSCTGEMDEKERAGPLTSETARKVKLVFAGTLCCIFLEQRHRRTMIKGLGAAIVSTRGRRPFLIDERET